MRNICDYYVKKKKREARSETGVVRDGFGGSDGAAAGWPRGDPACLHVGAPTQRLRQPSLPPLIGSDKVAAHAARLQKNALRRELTGLPLFHQTLLHVTFGTRAFFPTTAAPQQGSRALSPYICPFITLNGFGEMQLGWTILHLAPSLAELHRLIKQRGFALFGIDSESITFTAWM